MSRLKKLAILVSDVVLLYASLALTILLRYGATEWKMRLDDHIVPFSIMFIMWLLVLYLFNLYQYKVTKSATLLNTVSSAVMTATLLSIAAFYFLPVVFNLTPKVNMVLFGVFFLILKYFWHKILLFRIFTSGAEGVVVLGNSPLIAEMVLHIKSHPHIGYRIAAWFDDPQLVDFEHVRKALSKAGAHLVVIQGHLAKDIVTSKLVYNLITHNINVLTSWDFYEIIFDWAPLEELEEGWFIQNISAHRPLYDSVKRTLDVFFATVMLIVLSPIILLVAILIALTSRGAIIFKQKRIGKNTKAFTLYKFRTMRQNTDGPLWTEKNDGRLTTTGRLLRASHLDELPQLFNILKGDISLIGPRPERVELVRKYETLPYYDIRHIIKPGLTGWPQVNYKPSVSMEEAKEKLCYDIYYIKNRSIFLDLNIALKTIRYFFMNHK